MGCNVPAQHTVFNDINPHIIRLLRLFSETDKTVLFEKIQTVIRDYHLSMVCENGYACYGCESTKGLSSYNKTPFLALRNDLNALSPDDERYYLLLYVVVIFAFNNQIRFNRSGRYNLPVGKRDFNRRMQKKVAAFCDRLQGMSRSFRCGDFSDMDINALAADDFVYVDPPYFIACATYNEQHGWQAEEEHRLLRFLDRLSERGVRFALSNVLESKGRENSILKAWLEENVRRYHVCHLDYSYSNANYHLKDRGAHSDEVLITNYQP